MKTEDKGQKVKGRSFVCREATRLYKWRGAAAATLLPSVLYPLSSVAETRHLPPAVSSGNIVQIIFSLLLVLAAIVLVAWLLKRMNVAQQGSGNQLKVLGGTSLGQRERIVLVEVQNTWLVVGVGPGQIRTLHTLDRPEDIAQQPDDNSSPAEKNRFAAILSNALGQLANGKRHAP